MDRFVAVDLEATHFLPRRASIIEIGAALFERGAVQATFQRFVRCSEPVPPKVTELTGISGQMLGMQGIELGLALQELADFVGSAPLVAHNGNAFDYPCLEAALRDLPFASELVNPLWDTLLLADALNLRPLKLSDLCTRYGITQTEHHRALADAIACGHLFLQLAPLAIGVQSTSFTAIREERAAKRVSVDISAFDTDELVDHVLAVEEAVRLLSRALKDMKEEIREQLAARNEAGEEAEFVRAQGKVALGKRTQRSIDREAVRKLLSQGALSLDDVFTMAKFEVGRADKVIAPDLLASIVQFSEAAVLRVTPSKEQKKDGLSRASGFLESYGLTLAPGLGDA